MTTDETAAVAVRRCTWWRENFAATFIVGMPAAVALGYLFVSLAPVRGLWLAQELIAGCVLGLLFGAAMAAMFKGPKAQWICARSATTLPGIHRALDDIGYASVCELGSRVIFRPTLRTGLASGWITMCEQDERLILVGPYRHLVRLTASVQARARGQ
jgi:hypothetical protein